MKKISAYEIALSALSCALATILLTVGVYSAVLLFTGYLLACASLMLPLAKKKLRRLRFVVYRNRYFVPDLQRFKIFRPASVYYVFRASPACERVAAQDKNQPLAGLRNQSAVV